jgi:ABC-2 type transport system ATP-binding protein
VLIDQGENVLYGPVAEIKHNFAGNAVVVEGQGDFNDVPGVIESRRENNAWHLSLDKGTDPQAVLLALAGRPGQKIDRFEVAEPSLDDIFISVVGREIGSDGARPPEVVHA